MFSWVGNFYRRHKRKLFITGLVLGGTYAAGKYLQYRVEKYFEKKYLDQATQARKDYHFRSNQKTCSMTFISFLPNIRNVIAEQLNTEELLEVLRLGPANKLELWEQLKLLSFARCITCIIINVVVYVFLKVQMNIMGGYMFIDGSTDDSEEDTGTSTKGERIAFREIQEEYLNTVKYILDHGLSDLIDDVSRAVKGLYKVLPYLLNCIKYKSNTILFLWIHLNVGVLSNYLTQCDLSIDQLGCIYVFL